MGRVDLNVKANLFEGYVVNVARHGDFLDWLGPADATCLTTVNCHGVSARKNV